MRIRHLLGKLNSSMKKRKPAVSAGNDAAANEAASVPVCAFMAAGKPYWSCKELEHTRTERDLVCLDTYGRQVVCLRERFPCMDSYDLLHENRYFRWYYIWNNGSWTQVDTHDGRSEVNVRENMRLQQVLNTPREMSGGAGWCMLNRFDEEAAQIMEEIERTAAADRD